MQSLYPEAEVIRDIGSGINFKRKGLRSLLDRLSKGDQLTLVVAHRYRLARRSPPRSAWRPPPGGVGGFGFELFQYMVEQNGGLVVVLDSTVHSPESELTQDLLSILHVFSCRMHRSQQLHPGGSLQDCLRALRKYRQKIKEDSDIIKLPTEADS